MVDTKTALVLAGAVVGLWLLRDRRPRARVKLATSADCIGPGDTFDVCLQFDPATATPLCLDGRDCTDGDEGGCSVLPLWRCASAFGKAFRTNPFADAQEQGGAFGSQFLE